MVRVYILHLPLFYPSFKCLLSLKCRKRSEGDSCVECAMLSNYEPRAWMWEPFVSVFKPLLEPVRVFTPARIVRLHILHISLFCSSFKCLIPLKSLKTRPPSMDVECAVLLKAPVRHRMWEVLCCLPNRLLYLPMSAQSQSSGYLMDCQTFVPKCGNSRCHDFCSVVSKILAARSMRLSVRHQN